MAGSMFQRAGRPGWFRDRMVMPDGLVRNRRRGTGNLMRYGATGNLMRY
jgi:hypothetical protein